MQAEIENEPLAANISVDIQFVQKADQQFVTEAIPCIRREDAFEVMKIPFYAKRIAVGDIIDAEYEPTEDLYYFNKKISASGNSTIRINCIGKQFIWEAKRELEQMGCQCDEYLRRNHLAVNVPKGLDYTPVKAFLEAGERNAQWEYEETCRSHIARLTVSYKEPTAVQRQMAVWIERFGRHLQTIREQRQLSLESVSKQLGTTVYDLLQIEKGNGSALGIGPFLRLCILYEIAPYEPFR
jgi:hypothetical protein